MKAELASRIKGNSYPGRGLVQGISDDGAMAYQLYWIMGRSVNSRNRIFVADRGTLATKAADPAKCEDPALVIYEAMLEKGAHFVVSNGDQTRTIAEGLNRQTSFVEALLGREREPDAPNYTPRISGQLDLPAGGPVFWFSIIKANSHDPTHSVHHFFRRDFMVPGTGMGLTTYEGDGKPLPSFVGEPMLLPMAGSVQDILQQYWEALDADNRIALALKSIPLQGGPSKIQIINKYAE